MFDAHTQTLTGAAAFEAARAQFDEDILTVSDVSTTVDPATELDPWDENYKAPRFAAMATIEGRRSFFRTEHDALLYCWAQGFSIREAVKRGEGGKAGIALYDAKTNRVAMVSEVPVEIAYY